MSTYTKYLKSSDPAVLATVIDNRRGLRNFEHSVKEFTEECGNTKFVFKTGWATYHLIGFPTLPEGKGRWTKDAPHRPYKSNEPWHSRFRSMAFTPEELPGLNSSIVHTGEGSYFNAPQMGGAVVVSGCDVYAKAAVPFDPARWVEVPTSEYHLAKEAEATK